MPEAREVKLYSELFISLIGKCVKITLISGQYACGQSEIVKKFRRDLSQIQNTELKSIRNYGKILILKFTSNLVIQPMLKGLFTKSASKINIKFDCEGADPIYFYDPINWAKFYIFSDSELADFLQPLGPNISETTSAGRAEFISNIKKKRKSTPIYRALLDQKVICGVGNWMRAESIYLAKLPHLIKCGEITQSQLENLWDAIGIIQDPNYEFQVYGKSDYIMDGKRKFYFSEPTVSNLPF